MTRTSSIELIDLCCGHEGMISSLSFAPTGLALISTSLDASARLWVLGDTQHPKIIDQHQYNVTCADWAPHGQALATSSDDRKVLLWSFPTLNLLGTLEGHPRGITRIAWSPNGGELTTTGNDRRIRVWDIVKKEIKAGLEGHVSLPRCIAYSPTGELLASGSEGGTIRLWKCGSYQPGHVLYGHRSGINDMAWMKDGRLGTASDDGTVRIWNLVSGACERELRGHSGAVKAVDFSPCGRLMATRSWDQTLRLWRTDNWELVLSLEEDTAAPFPNLAFHPKEPLLASVGAVDRVVRLWRLDLDALASAAAAFGSLNFRDQEVKLLLARGYEELASTPPGKKSRKKKGTKTPADIEPTVKMAPPSWAVQPEPTAPPETTSKRMPKVGKPPAAAPVSEALGVLQDLSCGRCGEVITESQIQRRLALGFSSLNCPVCETSLSLKRDLPGTLRDYAGTNKLILAVMFTDIVDSSALANRVGNQAMRGIRHQHFERVRMAIWGHHGYEVKTIGDSFMAAFRTAGDGLGCALDVLHNTGHPEVSIRASLHVGPVEVDENDLFGNMVNFCARLMGQADGAELVVSEEARSHVMQEGDQRYTTQEWNPNDNVVFKGFPGNYRVWILH